MLEELCALTCTPFKTRCCMKNIFEHNLAWVLKSVDGVWLCWPDPIRSPASIVASHKLQSSSQKLYNRSVKNSTTGQWYYPHVFAACQLLLAQCSDYRQGCNSSHFSSSCFMDLSLPKLWALYFHFLFLLIVSIGAYGWKALYWKCSEIRLF